MMIYLNREIESAFKVDPDLVADYKVICDRYLVNIRRNLTKQLIFYKVYYDLQQVNNAYFLIIDKLLNGLYENIESLKKDNSDFVKCCNVFVKSSTTVVPENVMDLVDADIDRLKLAMNKLIYILENYCLQPEEKANEVCTIF